MGRAQKEKGANAEREVAKIFREHGFDARRGQVFNGDPDVVTPLPFHIEVKRQETLRINDWWKQSESAASDTEIPTVVFRRNHEKWKIILSLTDFLRILKILLLFRKDNKENEHN